MNRKIKKVLNKKNKSKIVCLTAYSKNIAKILDRHCDIVLVGDSLGSVLYNYKSTKQVTLQTMINHSKSVRLGVEKSLMVFVICFLSPFVSLNKNGTDLSLGKNSPVFTHFRPPSTISIISSWFPPGRLRQSSIFLGNRLL